MLINIAIHVHRLADGPAVAETAARYHPAKALANRSKKILGSSPRTFCRWLMKASSPQPIGVLDGGRLAGSDISTHVDDDIGCGVPHRDRSSSRGHGGQSCYRGNGHERPDGADREDEGSDDVTPNAHDSSMRLPRPHAYDLDPAAPPTSLSVFFIHQSAADFMYYADI